MTYSSQMMPGEPFKSAQVFWEIRRVSIFDAMGSFFKIKRATDHADYMDFAELYADYVVEYEKVNSQ